MRTLTLELLTDGFAKAVLKKKGRGSVTLKTDADDKWDREGLLKLSAALKGVAEMLPRPGGLSAE